MLASTAINHGTRTAELIVLGVLVGGVCGGGIVSLLHNGGPNIHSEPAISDDIRSIQGECMSIMGEISGKAQAVPHQTKFIFDGARWDYIKPGEPVRSSRFVVSTVPAERVSSGRAATSKRSARTYDAPTAWLHLTTCELRA